MHRIDRGTKINSMRFREEEDCCREVKIRIAELEVSF
jgi:hypothetical protein